MKLTATLCTVLLVAATPCYAVEFDTASALVEKTIDPLPQAKSLIGIEETVLERIVAQILKSNLEPGQKNDLVKDVLAQQFEAKKSFWTSFFSIMGQYVLPIAGSAVAVWRSTTK